MLRSVAIAVLGLLCSAAAVCAQQKSLEPSPVNAARLRWMQYKLVSGRIVATSTYPEGMNISFGPSSLAGSLREQLQLLILKDQVSVRYDLAGDGEELAIVLSETGEFSIRRVASGGSWTMEFVQPVDRSLVLTVSSSDGTRIITGESFWHLYLEAPDLVREQLVPYLEILRPAWQLSATAAEVEHLLYAQAESAPTGERADWQRMIEELGATNFARRERAQRDLEAVGQQILPFLKALNPRALDAEQAERVKTVIASLDVEYEDSAPRVASWLAADPQVWLSLGERPQRARREVAARQLKRLAGGSLVFDPDAEEPARQQQLDKFRARFASGAVAVQGAR